MKKLLLLSILITACSIMTCEKEDPNTLKETDIKLSYTKNYLPLETFKANTSVVFKNESGEEKTLTLTVTEETKEKQIDNHIYTTEQIAVAYKDPLTADTKISIKVSAKYININQYKEFFSITTLSRTSGLLGAYINIGEDAKELTFTRYLETFTLLNKEFNDVYKGTDYSTETSINFYSKIYYTMDTGIIGFKDGYGALWVYDRYEQ